MGPLRVVFVDHVARLSGGEIALLRLLPELSQHAEIRVLLGEEGPLVARLQEQGITTEVLAITPRLRDLRKDTIGMGSVDTRALAAVPGYILALRHRIRELDPDIVHTNSLKAALYGGVAGRLAGVPVVWHIRDRVASDYLPTPAVRLVRLLSRVLPTAVIANSHSTMNTLPRRWHSSVFYNPIFHDAVDPTLRQRRRPHAPLMIGMIGRLAPWKGQDVFLDAFAAAFKGENVDARLIGSALFGEEAYAASLDARAIALGVEEQVEFRGFREDVFAELRELDILVHCSVRPEPFGQVVLEGMVAGVPVVAADVGGPAEVITNGVDGILTAPGDVEELADALRMLADDWVLRAKIGAAGRHRSRDFAPERAVEQLLEFYDWVLRRR